MKKRIFVWVLMFHDGAPTVLQYQTVLPDCNICSPLLCPTLPQCTIRLIDFGLARLMPASNELLQTPAEHRPARLVAWIGCSDARCCSFQPNIPLACGLMPFLLHPWAVPEGGSGALSAAVGITEHCPPPLSGMLQGVISPLPLPPLLPSASGTCTGAPAKKSGARASPRSFLRLAAQQLPWPSSAASPAPCAEESHRAAAPAAAASARPYKIITSTSSWSLGATTMVAPMTGCPPSPARTTGRRHGMARRMSRAPSLHAMGLPRPPRSTSPAAPSL